MRVAIPTCGRWARTRVFDVWAGLDLGLRHDATALVVVARDGERIVLVDHKVFVPAAGETLT